MANGSEELESDISKIKATVRKSFALIYATLKARELKTLRQLDAICKQCQNNKDVLRNCVHNLHISYENESTLLNNIDKYGVLDLERLNFDSNTFAIEDYVCPNDDHMYSYKGIEDLREDEEDLSAIEAAALKQITSTRDCVCYVNIRPEDVSRKFRDPSPLKTVLGANIHIVENNIDRLSLSSDNVGHEQNNSSDPEIKKIEPTDEWLNTIKNQTETEPTQTSDIMEHSTIACK